MSSKRLTDKSSIRTMSGLARMVLMLVGIVAGGDSEALHEGISACRLEVAGSVSRTFERRQFRTESCLHVYLPWVRASWHPFRIWADMGVGELHSAWAFTTDSIVPASEVKGGW